MIEKIDEDFAEKFLPIELIRSHTKTDDVISITDVQIELYRQAAIEAAQKYIGIIIGPARTITETPRVVMPQDRTGVYIIRATKQQRIKIETTYPVLDGLIYYTAPNDDRGMLHVDKNSKRGYAPFIDIDFLNNCCNPCGTTNNGINQGFEVQYKTGFSNVADVPAGIKLGCLKFVAWSIENPGDVLVNAMNINVNRGAGAIGSNDTQWASGATELWNKYIDDVWG